MTVINGYIVVYYPEKCRFFLNGKWIYNQTIRDNINYYGLFRSQWEELGTAYWYDPNLSQDLKATYERIRNSIKWLYFGIPLNSSLEDTKCALEFSNKNNPNSCEIIAIYSKFLTINQAEFHSIANIRWIGYDVVRIYRVSLIEHGVFGRDPFFEKWKDRLNEYGLISDTGNYDNDFKVAQELIDDYIQHEKDYNLEKISDNTSLIDMIRIGIVDVGSRGQERALEKGE